MGFNPKLKKGVVILSNSTEAWPDEFGYLILNPDYKRPVIDESLANDHEYLNKFVGHYIATIPDMPEQELTISLYGKSLVLTFSGTPGGMLYPESYGVFGVKGDTTESDKRSRIFFSFNKAGSVEKLEARDTDGTVLWEAVPK